MKMYLNRTCHKCFVSIKLFLLLCATVAAVKINAQSYAGVTNTMDTSYSNYSAFIRTKQEFAEAKVVPDFKPVDVEQVYGIIYNTIGKRNLRLDAFLPKEKNKINGIAIIIIHGGGWRSGNRTQHHQLAQRLAELGYTCFTPEYRLSTEALFPAGIFDIKEAIRWVRKHALQYKLDTAKIVSMGFSAGGEMAAFMGTTGNMPLFEGPCNACDVKSNVNAVVDLDGTLSFVHPESGESDESKHPSAGAYWFGYTKSENPELWKAASPLNYVGGETPPTLFINSSVARMHAGRNDYIKILNEYHIYSEVHSFDTAPHSFPMFHPWFEPTIKYTDEFLQRVFSK